MINTKESITNNIKIPSKNLRGIADNVKSYANKKQIDIDFITRY